MVIVAKFWEVLNALFKIHNCAAAEDVVRGREEGAVCTFIETCLEGEGKVVWGQMWSLRDAVWQFSRTAIPLPRNLPYLRVPFIPQPPTWHGNTWGKLRRNPAPHPASSLGMLPPPLPQNRNTLSSEQNWEFPRGEPHWKLKNRCWGWQSRDDFFLHPQIWVGETGLEPRSSNS